MFLRGEIHEPKIPLSSELLHITIIIIIIVTSGVLLLIVSTRRGCWPQAEVQPIDTSASGVRRLDYRCTKSTQALRYGE